MPMPETQERPTLEQEVLEWADSVYDEAELELSQSKEIKLTAKLIDYIQGQQWTAKARFGRSRPTVNRVFRHFIEMAGLLTDLEPDYKVHFPNEDEQTHQLEELLNENIGLWARMTDFETELSQSVMWALVNTGFAKCQWNPAMFGGLGDNEFIPLGPMHVMSIGAGNKLQDDECVIARWPVTIESLYRNFDRSLVNQVQPDLDMGDYGTDINRPNRVAPQSWSRFNPQLKRLMGIKSPNLQRRTRYPKVMLKQFWFKDGAINETSQTKLVGTKGYNWSYMVEPGEPLFPRGRFVIVAGGKVLQDQCNPYWHGMFPFAKLRLLRVPWSTHGVSPLEPIALMQDIINRINGGIMDMIRAVIEPKIIAPRAAFSQAIWDSIDPGAPGGKLMYNNNSPQKPEMPKGPELPSYVLTTKQDIEREQDATSGSAAISQAIQKKQVPGGDSLEMILNSRSIPIRFMGRGLHSFLTDVGTMNVSNTLQFSNAKARAARFGAKGYTDSDFQPYYGQFLQKGMKPEEFVKSVVFEIRKGSLLSIEKNDEVQVAMVLRKMGDVSRRALLRKLGLSKPEIDKIEEELLQEAQVKIALAGEAGALTHKGGKK